MIGSPERITLEEWDARYEQLSSAGMMEPFYGGPLRRHVESIYPSQMLREMHLYTLCTDIGRGKLTLAEALLKPPAGRRPDISNLRLGG